MFYDHDEGYEPKHNSLTVNYAELVGKQHILAFIFSREPSDTHIMTDHQRRCEANTSSHTVTCLDILLTAEWTIFEWTKLFSSP